MYVVDGWYMPIIATPIIPIAASKILNSAQGSIKVLTRYYDGSHTKLRNSRYRQPCLSTWVVDCN